MDRDCADRMVNRLVRRAHQSDGNMNLSARRAISAPPIRGDGIHHPPPLSLFSR